MTAFSDFPAPAEHPLHPTAAQVHAYLEDYARAFGVVDHVRLHSRVGEVRPGWTVDGEPFDAVVVASGRFRKPRLPRAVDGFSGETLHAFDYPGADRLRDRATLVYGNGISGLEIASDLAPHAPVVSAFRKPRYVIQKVVDGVSSDWQWYTLFGALERRLSPSDEWSAPAARADPPRGRQPRRLRRAGAERRPPRGGHVALSGLPGAGARRQHRVPSRHRLGRGAERHLHRRHDRGRRGHHLRDRLRPSTFRTWRRTSSDRTSSSTSGRSTRTCPALASSASSSLRGRTSRCSSCRRAGSWRSGAAR